MINIENLFYSVSADQIWKGVTEISNNARKKGGGNLTKKFINLNKNRQFGKGPSGHIWPGFTVKPIDKSKKLVNLEVNEPGDSEQLNFDKTVGKYGGRKRVRISLPHDYRGFSGQSLNGMKIDNPKNTPDCNL